MIDAVPEWVQVWQWARVSRVPREVRPFPQQALYGHEESITQAEYEALAAEWRKGWAWPRSDAEADVASFADFLNELA